MKRISILLLLIALCLPDLVQAQFSNFGSNQMGSSASGLSRGRRDRNGNPIDTTAVNDASTLPIGMYAWKVDSKLGTIRPVQVDTLTHAFQNTNDTGGMNGEYNYLGNLGSPRLSRIYFNRRDFSQFLFTDPFDCCVLRPEDVTFFNTLSPFTNLSYHTAGGNRNKEERFKSYFAWNVNKRFGFGFYIDYLYGRGQYADQSTALFNGGLFTSYRGDKYNLHFIYSNDNLKMKENGGITDDRYISDPVGMAEGKKEYRPDEIPTRLHDVWNHSVSHHAFLTHNYNLGFHREKEDSISPDSVRIREIFIPVTSFIHTFEMDMNKRKYISYDDAQNQTFFANNFLGNDSIDDTKRLSIKNTFAIKLHEGFNKWVPAGLAAFVTHEHRSFSLTDSTKVKNQFTRQDYKENMISVGGELSKRLGKTLHYVAKGEVTVTGEEAGNFSLEGKGDLNFRLWGDTVRLEANAFVKNQLPVFYFRHFHSKHYWWDNDDLSKTMRTRVEGKLTFDKWGTQLRVGAEDIKNYTYLANTSIRVSPDDAKEPVFKNNAAVNQYGGHLQVFSAMLQQKLKFGIFHFDAELAYQKSSEQEILPLPDFTAYGNMYISTALAKKVLKLELGADVRYFTKYNAPDYTPVMGQFYTQNPEDKVEIGGYPIINVYANLHLKRTRFFVMMYHVNQSNGNYFLAPHYALNPRMIKFGLSWNFFD